MRFDLIDLRLFVHVAEAGSLTGGAQRAHMTLASASQRVRGMEDTLGHPLLTRHAQGVRPTEAGRTLLHHARVVMQQMEQLRAELGAHGQGLQGRVRLLCNTSAMTEHLPMPLGRFLAQHPKLSIDLEERPSGEIAAAVQEGRADLGIVSDAVNLDGLETLPFRYDDLVLVVARSDPVARCRRIALAELNTREWVGLADGNPLQEHVAQQARRQGQRLAYRVRVRSFDAVCSLVEQGIGAGIVPLAAARRCGRTMKIARVALTDRWAQRQLLCVAKDAAALSPHARGLLAHLCDAPAATVRPR